MVQDALLVCGNCSKNTALHAMRYNSTGDFLICTKCYNKEHNKQEQEDSFVEELELERPKLAPTRPRHSLDHVGFERLQLQCTNCGYKFSQKKDAHRKASCPYCGHSRVEQHQSLGAKSAQKGSGVFWDINNLF